jgi:acetolactate synthase small subunit
MTVFLGATPHSTPDSFTNFRLSAAANASVLTRIVGLFAKLSLVPEAFSAKRAAGDVLDVEIRVTGLSAQQAEHVARTMRQIIEVDHVLVALEEPAQVRAQA